MSGLFGRWADLNRDGEVDNFEEFMAMEMLMSDDETEEDDDLYFDDTETELEAAGLDCEELSWMNEEERREVLEDAGLDPDDYDF